MIETVKVFDAVAVAETGHAHSALVEVSPATLGMSLAGYATSATGTAEVKVEYEASHNGSNFDETTTSPSRTILASWGESYLVTAFDMPAAPFVRLTVTGINANPADTVVTFYLSYVRS